MAEEIAKLAKKRQGCMNRMNTMITTVNKHNNKTSSMTASMVQILLDDIIEIKRNFSEIFEEVYCLCATDEEVKTQSDIADTYFAKSATIIEALRKIKTSFPVPVPVNTNNSIPENTNNIKLPDLKIPTFDGKFENWISFSDLFLATIDCHPKLSNGQKLQYLKSSVSGDASQLIQSFQITDSNYKEAWTTLKQRYDNEREIVNSIIKRILSQPSIQRESASLLQKLLDTTLECVRALTVLKRPVNYWDDILIYIVVEKMDPDARRQWAMRLKGTEIPTLKQLEEFIIQHVRGLTAGGISSKSTSHFKTNSNSTSGTGKQTSSFHSTTEPKCAVCNQQHFIHNCEKLASLTPTERSKLVISKSLCINCLRPNHKAQECKSRNRCRKCSKLHHTLLHFERKQITPSQQQLNAEVTVNSSFTQSQTKQVLLSTALVKVMDSSGTQRLCRALLDNGSQASFITESCANALGLKKFKSAVNICGISTSSIGTSKGSVSFNVQSLVQNSSFDVQALILPKVTGYLPTQPCDPSQWTHISGIKLADPTFHQPGPVDILFGADIVVSIMRDGRIEGPSQTPTAQNSILGWVLAGEVSTSSSSSQIQAFHCELDNILQKFWETEEIPSTTNYSNEEEIVEKHFSNNYSRNAEGRFIVSLPFNNKINNIGLSRDKAISRLKHVERRLQAKINYKVEYSNFMQEYLNLKHMELVPTTEVNNNKSYYLPHHFVLKEESSSTKFRVVFDGSAQTTTGISLNDCMMVGPTIQNDLFTLLLRFRCYLIALKADIGKMYRQFLVSPSQTDYQRIVWRNSTSEPIKDYRLLTVTYGTASAAYLATKCLQQLAKEEETNYPEAAFILANDFYVDDLLSGASSQEEAILLHQQLCQLVQLGGMDLRKWCCSDTAVLNQINPDLREKLQQSISFDSDSSIKALGIQWNPDTDNFSFKLNEPVSKAIITKRILLSELAKVFDPLGWLSPVTIQAKILFQELWKCKLGWDEELPADTQAHWHRYQNDLTNIKLIQIPRCIISKHLQSQQLHGFSDASTKAYAAAIYLRSQLSSGDVIVHLIAAKTKVAPIKTVSIPRLELNGALLLSNLMKTVIQATKLNCEVFAWCDSTVVLHWISSHASRWKTFVANRVSEIQKLIPPEKWKHVASELNPADPASRGITASTLLNLKLWWEGPKFLKQLKVPTFNPADLVSEDVQAEEKKQSKLIHHTCISSSLISRFSSLTTLKRVTAYCLRFIYNLKHKNQKKTGFLTSEELEEALKHWIIFVQDSSYGNEIKSLKKSSTIASSSKIHSLNPFLDKFGILRVGGRLHKSDLPENRKHQVILPHDSIFTKLLIQQAHLNLHHAGFQLLWSYLQREYWILRARDTIRLRIKKCVICRRNRAETMQQLMGSLPAARVKPGRPFNSCGVDFAGPYLIKAIKGKGVKRFKSYFCIFVCLATKAIHLEAVSSLSAEGFIAALKRFCARRGISSHIYSDCGSNFVGADKELQQLLQSTTFNSSISSHLSNKGTNWHFNPPSSPHHGGLWEAGVKSVKFHLKRIVGPAVLNFEEFQTVLCQVEACLNSRPLTAMSSDPMDFNVLTPGHFLIGDAITAVPEPDLTSIKINRLSRWQYTQQLVQHFWKRWSSEYLSSLQQRFKWKAKRDNLAVGDLVIIKDERFQPMQWEMGRIIQVHPGADEIVRVVTLKTANGEYQRPVVKLCPILYNDEES